MTRPRLDPIDTVRTRDKVVTFPDGGWASYRVKPAGIGWTILRDAERYTLWTRHSVVVPFPKRHRRGGWGRHR